MEFSLREHSSHMEKTLSLANPVASGNNRLLFQFSGEEAGLTSTQTPARTTGEWAKHHLNESKGGEQHLKPHSAHTLPEPVLLQPLKISHW